MLYINNHLKGTVPYINDDLACEDKEKLTAALHVIVKSGTHHIVVKNVEGDELFKEKVKLKKRRNNISISSTSTNQDISVFRTTRGNCIIEEIKF